MSDYHTLKVWHRSLDFTASVYEITSSFPSHELYGLVSQIRRAATSIVLNIAEGSASGYNAEYARILRLSIRSANEVAAGFEIAKRLNYCSSLEADTQIAEINSIASMLQGLSKSLRNAGERGEPYLLDQELLDTSPSSQATNSQ